MLTNANGQPAGVATRADVYTSSLDSQWIDVTGVAPGSYFIEVTLDANNAVLESDETNNTIRVPVMISASGSTAVGIQPDRFDNIALNNTFETATDFGELGDRSEASLTLHAGYDEDFYKFVATSTGPLSITLPSSGGDPNLYFYAGDRTELARSTRASGTESVSTNVTAGRTYYIRVNNYQYTDALVNNNSLLIDGPAPAVQQAFDRTRVREGTQAVLRIRRNGPLTTPITAPLVFGGTATKGVDYTVDTEVASFGADANEVIVTITTLRDRIREDTEFVDVSLAPNAAYVDGPAARVSIVDGLGFYRNRPEGSGRNLTLGDGQVGGAPEASSLLSSRRLFAAGIASPFADTPLSALEDDLLPERYAAA